MKLRLVLFEECDRACRLCCNKSYDIPALPACSDYTSYSEIMLTGGEPMLRPELVLQAVREIRSQTAAPIYLYTAKVDDLGALLRVLRAVDGATVTCHSLRDVQFAASAFGRPDWRESSWLAGKSLRLKVPRGRGCVIPSQFPGWDVVPFSWRKDCPVPEGEVLMRYAPLALEHRAAP